jgi:Bacterial Ig-like domain
LSPYDGITSNTTPSFRVALPRNAEAGDLLEITRANIYSLGNRVAHTTLTAEHIAAGFVDLTSNTLPAGTYTSTTAITAWFTDRASNRSTGVSLAGSLVVDLTPPNTGTFINLMNADDTGVSASDNLVRFGTNLSFGNNASYPLPSDVVQVEMVDVFNGTTTTLGYASINASRIWSFTYRGTALADGTHSIGMRTTDAAGNTSAISTTRLALVVDSSPSSIFTAALTAATDTGTVGDNLTRSTQPVIAGMAEPSARISVFRDANGNGVPEPNEQITTNDNVTTFIVANSTTGAYSFTMATQAVGARNYIVVQQDRAGNFSTLTVPLTVDRTAPAPRSLVMLNADDSGYFATDRITADASPTFRVNLPTDVRVGDRVEFYIRLNSAYTSTTESAAAGIYVAMNRVLDANDLSQQFVDFTVTNTLPDRTLWASTRITDVMGNVSPEKGMSLGAITGGSVNLQVDTRPAPDSNVPFLVVADGASSLTTDSLVARTATTTANRLFTLQGTIAARATTDSALSVVYVEVFDRLAD